MEAIGINQLDTEGVHGIVVSVRDVSERKQAEEHRLELETRLQQASKMQSIGRLAGGIIDMDFTGSPEEAAHRSRGVMDILAPEVIYIPQVSLTERDDAAAHDAAMREVSRENAERVRGA